MVMVTVAGKQVKVLKRPCPNKTPPVTIDMAENKAMGTRANQ